MDFGSLGTGSPFYILRKDKSGPVLEMGVVKEKSAPQAKYQPQANPNAFSGMGMQQVISVTITMNGNDRIISDIPVGIEIAQRGNETFTGSREACLQAVDAMVQASKKHISENQYHEVCIREGEKMYETLNPNYAEEKRRAQSIHELQEKSDAQDRRLATLEEQNTEILGILRSLNGAPAKSTKPQN